MAVRRERAAEVAERAAIVFDMFEHVHADDRVDVLGSEIVQVVCRQWKPEGRDAYVGPLAEPRLELPDVMRLDVGGDDSVPNDEVPGLVADTGADLEDPRSDVVPEAGIQPL